MAKNLDRFAAIIAMQEEKNTKEAQKGLAARKQELLHLRTKDKTEKALKDQAAEDRKVIAKQGTHDITEMKRSDVAMIQIFNAERNRTAGIKKQNAKMAEEAKEAEKNLEKQQ